MRVDNNNERESNSRSQSADHPRLGRTLLKYGDDLTQKALRGEIDNCIGREEEITSLIRILCKKRKRNPLLIGPAGVGKTAIVEGVAYQIAHEQIHDNLVGKSIYEIHVSSLMADSSVYGSLEDKVNKIIKDLKNSKERAILFIDEIHTILTPGTGGNALKIADALKPALARSDIQIIGATTEDEAHKFLESDKALLRRFQIIKVKEPGKEDTLQILSAVKNKLSVSHGVEIPEALVENSYTLCERYLRERYFPDKAIDLLDEATSHCKLNPVVEDQNQNQEEEGILSESIRNGDYDESVRIFRSMNPPTGIVNHSRSLNKDDLENVISKWTGIPVDELQRSYEEKINNLQAVFDEKIIGQAVAKRAIIKCLQRFSLNLNNDKKPLGVFLFVGPSGVGKTEIARIMSNNLMPGKENFLRLDMSEYAESHSRSRLIGSPPGYVGYEEGGQLVEHVRKNPYCLIVFDEIEKAHPSLFDLFLQIFEEGSLIDGKGNKADFSNTIIIMTSNLRTQGNVSIGFTENENATVAVSETDENHLRSMLTEHLRSELIGRISNIVEFTILTRDEINQIVRKELSLKIRLLEEKLGIHLETDESVYEYLNLKSYSVEFGARNVQTNIGKLFEEAILDYYFKNKQVESILISVTDNIICVNERHIDSN